MSGAPPHDRNFTWSHIVAEPLLLKTESVSMTPCDLSKAKNPDLRGSMDALRRAAKMARATAIQTNTGIVIVRDGHPVWISADELARSNLRAPRPLDHDSLNLK